METYKKGNGRLDRLKNLDDTTIERIATREQHALEENVRSCRDPQSRGIIDLPRPPPHVNVTQFNECATQLFW